MNNLTITELLREADNSENPLVIALSQELQEVIEEIELLSACDDTEAFESQIEYIKKLVGLPNNY